MERVQEIFENHARLYDLSKREDGKYANRDTQCLWQGYEAAAKEFNPQYGKRDLDIHAFLVALGAPHVKTAFRGDGNPTDEQVAHEIGKAMMRMYFGDCEEENSDEATVQD